MFAQWEKMTDAIERSREQVEPDHWFDLHLEDLLERPHEMLERLCRAIDIPREPQLTRALDELVANPVNPLLPAGAEKWRNGNSEEIGRLLPRISRAALQRGYRVDPRTGACEVDPSR